MSRTSMTCGFKILDLTEIVFEIQQNLSHESTIAAYNLINCVSPLQVRPKHDRAQIPQAPLQGASFLYMSQKCQNKRNILRLCGFCG
jgi:hypothetical protein